MDTILVAQVQPVGNIKSFIYLVFYKYELFYYVWKLNLLIQPFVP